MFIEERFFIFATAITLPSHPPDFVEVIQNRMAIVFINFNGGKDSGDTDQIQQDDINADAVNSIHLRLYARAVLGISAAKLKQKLLDGERKLFDQGVLEYISAFLHEKQNVPKGQTVGMFLHIDEVQLALAQAVEIASNNSRFVKDMIQAIGAFRTEALKKELFIIPLLTGTNIGTLEFELTQYRLYYLQLEALSVTSSFKALEQQVVGKLPNTQQLFRNTEFSRDLKIVLYSLGVIPRALHIAIDATTSLLKSQTDPTLNPEHICPLIVAEIRSFYLDTLKSTLLWLSDSTFWSLVNQIFNQDALVWTAETQKLAQKGLVYANTDQKMFWPHFFYNLIFDAALSKQWEKKEDCEYTFKLFMKLFPFPFPSKQPWKHFEKMAIGSIVLRMRLAHHQNQKYISLKQLLPGANFLEGFLEDVRVKVCPLRIVKEEKKWLNGGAKAALKIADEDTKLEVVDLVKSLKDTINFFECNHASLLTDGTSILDGRVLLEVDPSTILSTKIPKETKFILRFAFK